MTVIDPLTELSVNHNIYINCFREGVSRPLLGEDCVIQSHTMRTGATSSGDGVTQCHAIGAGKTSGAYCDFQSHPIGTDITSSGDRITQSHTTGLGTTSGAYCDIQGHAIGTTASPSGGHVIQSNCNCVRCK